MSQYDPNKHHRRSIRKPDYDYSAAGLYFITICVQRRLCLFGHVHEGSMHLNDAGRMVEEYWLNLPWRFPNIRVDAFQLMPNHLHGIIEILEPNNFSREIDPTGKNIVLGAIVGAFKSEATNAYIAGVKENNWSPFDKKLFQRDYWEHIIRNKEAYDRICWYIANNPANWPEDSLHQ